VGLRGNDLLLNLHQQRLRFGQRQTEVGDLAKTISGRLIAITSRLTINPRPNQTKRPFRPRVPTRHHTRPVVSL
jgi:hypothetical protein